ncbi:molybdopterin biosynthesis protein [Pseudonocardia sp. KRD-184]|uniref:Molybdopterin molybdenumtransferase n=1 Tax=Pseudonocardia oceani TaxID=2792013 RepID=A0ABS6U274_9PSEU|nr:molybdopterin-binding protein [Pseudonocardia oceani]MBW0090231.1 molybdopterin biosynthesis protein [Pseudonocardia oceani]MBW0097437.1 molybdopterin biosynthesis protein [Pseudonocardia oceani]MBW0110098.1 molybdopterin biosynthesis protein [Pseudonocardia oceani]MBW0124194.1 molybdopterin biosynthesis protein [Pseudonocardia oceani]MBW0126241.1 molybdopterin biosynthesis protein [Pseudonocardia oceani]
MTAHTSAAPPPGAPVPEPDAVRADPAAEAFRSWLRACTRSGWAPEAVVETVEVRRSRGRVTAGPTTARWAVPAYRAAAMDGVAVADGDLSEAFPQVLGPAAHTWVDTGDPLPGSADRVVVREIVNARPDGSVEIVERPSGRHVRAVGEDMAAGAAVLPGGHRIRPVDVAALAAAGYLSITVRRRPRVAIVPTGDEIRPIGSSLRPGEILDTNSLMLEGLLAEAGCEAWSLPVVPDAPDALAAALAGAAQTADLVLVLAGSSAGRDDHTRAVIARLGQVAVHGVAVRPGHPVLLGVLGGDTPEVGGQRPAAPPVPVVGVPGYPASAERAFDGFVAPLVRRILGVDAAGPHPVTARLAVPVDSARRLDEYLRVRVATVTDPATGSPHLIAVPLPRGAGALSTLTRAEAVLRVPVGVDGVAAGAAVRVLPVAGAAFAAGTTVIAGRASPAVDALVDAYRADAPDCVLHLRDLADEDAVDALATGLCHAATTTLPIGGAHAEAAARLAGRLGAITVLEIARSGDRVEALIVPASAFDSAPVVELRSTLSSMTFRRRLRDLPGHSGRTSGRETWYAPPAGGAGPAPAHAVHGADPADGAPRCATR